MLCGKDAVAAVRVIPIILRVVAPHAARVGGRLAIQAPRAAARAGGAGTARAGGQAAKQAPKTIKQSAPQVVNKPAVQQASQQATPKVVKTQVVNIPAASQQATPKVVKKPQGNCSYHQESWFTSITYTSRLPAPKEIKQAVPHVAANARPKSIKEAAAPQVGKQTAAQKTNERPCKSGKATEPSVVKQTTPQVGKQTSADVVKKAAPKAEACTTSPPFLCTRAIVDVTSLLHGIAYVLEHPEDSHAHVQLNNQVDVWIKTFGTPGNTKEFEMLRAYLDGVYRQTKSQIEQEMKRNKKSKSINITVIGHGSIRHVEPFVLSKFHYISKNVASVTFFQPWGCLLHSSAAYGIVTNLITTENRYFDGELVAAPRHWNTIPNDMTPVPLVYFSPVQHTDQVWRDLTTTAHNLLHGADGIVFEYIPMPGVAEVLPQQFPLPMLCTIFGLAARVFDVEVNIRIASCLEWDNENPSMYAAQYHTIPGHPKVAMHCDLGHHYFDVDMDRGGTSGHL